ncbi:MAG: EAL domain-containing protein, partial [Sphingomicrobium sp.]
ASLLSDPQSDAIVNTILSLGRALRLPITAEGIENDGTRERLRSMGCSDGQGWLFGKAVPGAEVSAIFGIEENAAEQVPIEAPSVPVTERRDRARRAAVSKRRR